MRPIRTLLTVSAAALSVPAAAQLGASGLSFPQISLPQVPLGETLDRATQPLRQTSAALLQLRIDRLGQLLRQSRELIEPDRQGAPARRGELLLVDPTPEVLATAERAGFGLAEREDLEALELTVFRLTLPRGLSLAQAEEFLTRLAPEAQLSPDNLHFQSGGSISQASEQGRASSAAPITTPIGVIDGAPGTGQSVTAVRGFAKGAPIASHHGSAITSLLEAAGARDVRLADIYGDDPAGGNAFALVRALNWLTHGGARVVSISLDGPNNAVVGKAVAAAQRKGVIIVAAVGNDGPAGPPAYPASYPGVLAVTGVDGRGRALLEAGRALHLDYAAPGADMLARNKAGKWVRVRGTSYAVPLVAARSAAALGRGAAVRPTLDREAEDLGPRGPDRLYGRGLVCGSCARRS